MSLPERKVGYSTWEQTAGYLDGDGAVIALVSLYNLSFHLTWADSYLLQLEQLKTFLESKGFHPAKIVFDGTAYSLPMYRQDEVLLAAKELLPFVCKKSYDLQTAIEYLENRITGSEAVERLNKSAKAGSRRAGTRYVHMPFLRNEGSYAGRVFGARRAAESRKLLTQVQVQEIIKCREAGISVNELMIRLNVSRATIYKAISGEYK